MLFSITMFSANSQYNKDIYHAEYVQFTVYQGKQW